MIYYLFDASALILFYQKANKKLDEIFVSKAKNESFIYVPQFCVPEVFNTFARLYYRDKKISEDIYNQYCVAFKEHVSSRKVIYCYDLHRYHNLNAHQLFIYDHTIPYDHINSTKSLSTLDILIISMGMELKRIHPPQDVFLVTADKRMQTVCKACPSEFPQVIFVKEKNN